MSVNKPDRRESSVQFDATYYEVFRDANFLVQHHFGAKDNKYLNNQRFLSVFETNVIRIVLDIGTNIRIANAIYPRSAEEYHERIIHQDKAIGLCQDLLTKYQLVMNMLRLPDDKYIEPIKDLSHEINCLKKWKDADQKRFKHLG